MLALRHYSLCLLAFLLFNSVLISQEADHLEGCGTKERSLWLKAYRMRMAHTALKGSDTTWLYVPCTFHITGSNAVSGYYELSSAFRALCDMNAQFEQARIRFYMFPGDAVRYLNNAAWHNHDWEEGAEMITENNIPDRFNIYIVQNPAGACGYSWLDAVVMGKSCSGPGNGTWAHEAGHHFSLPHTFSGWEDATPNYNQPAPETVNGWAVEKMDGSNCYEAGDLFCDTRPDYLSYRWSCNDDLQSTQLQKDPNGVQFRSNAQWFMSYSLDACMRSFSPEQIAAMRENLRTEHASYLQTQDHPEQIPDTARVHLLSPIDSQIISHTNIPFRWKSVPNATYYHVEIFFYPNMTTRLFSQMAYKDTAIVVPKLINNRAVFWRVRAYSEADVCVQTAGEEKGIFQTRNFSAVNDLERLLTVEVSPNPATDHAQITLYAEKNMDAQLRVTNANGQVFIEKNVRLYSGENTLPLWLDTCPEGIHWIIISNAQGSIVRRVAVGR